MYYNSNQQNYNQNWQKSYNVIDLISVLSFFLGLENLAENREQSAHNDVQAANDKQADFLLENINERFERIEAKLDKILGVIEKYGVPDSDI